MNAALPWIPLLPALGAGLCAIGGRRLGLRGSSFIVVTASLVSLVLCCLIAFQGVIAGNIFQEGKSEVFNAGPFIQFSEEWSALLGLRMDLMSGLMSLLVTLFGTLILLFSIDYMREDDSPVRYFASLSLFISAMLILVLSENLVLLFLGWEGVGLCSYLLIGHEWKKSGVPLAAYRAFFVNRIGDLFFILGVFLLLKTLGTVSFSGMSQKFETMSGSLDPLARRDLLMASFLLLGGAFGKSAQVPLHVWLPDAMAGPTPVSALIHAATMVTAGVFLVARLNWLYTAIPEARGLLLICGSLTLLVGAVLACFQSDIKKVLAYSTLSHLGLMFIALAAGSVSAGLFHLFGHASFKAISFLAAGSIILAAHHEQDLHKLRGSLKHLPVTRVALWTGAIGGAGLVPFLASGFFSKEAVLHSISEASFGVFGLTISGGMFYWFVFGAELLGVVYLFRMLALLESKPESHESHASHAIEEKGVFIRAVLAILVLVAIAFGVASSPFVSGFSHFLFDKAEHVSIVDICLASGSSILVAIIVFVVFRADAAEAVVGTGARSGLIRNLFYFDKIYSAVLLAPLGAIGSATARFIEVPIFQGALRGGAAVSRTVSSAFSRMQKGLISQYAVIMIVSAAIVMLLALLA